jgi:hypothetical protein
MDIDLENMAAMKVKLFCQETLPRKFDEEINEFMARKEIRVVDVKFNVIETCGNIRLYALVLYEER